MRAANPASAAELRGSIDDEELSRAMHRAIATGSSTAQPSGDRFLRRRRGVAIALGAGLACLAAIAMLLLFGGGSMRGGRGPEFATAAIAVAEVNPRLLVTEPGWAVTDAGEFEADEGEVSFSDGTHRFDVHWYPARFYRRYLRDRALVSTPETSKLLGHTATTIRYGLNSGGAEYATMFSPQGAVFVEVRGGLDSRAEYEAILDSLRQVDVDTWLAAMPPNVVRPQARGAVVDKMLREVPPPPGFDLAALEGEDSVLNHYQLPSRWPARSPVAGSKAGWRRPRPATDHAPRKRSRRWRPPITGR
jgi:hypothetical protein